MKVSLFVFTLLCFVFSANAQPEHDGYILNGRVPGITSGVVYFSEFVNNGKRDSAVIENGSFQFTGMFKNPMPVIIGVKGKTGSFLFFAENKKMELVLDKDNLNNSKLTGSVSQADYQEYDQKIQSQNDRLNALSAWSRSKGKLDKKTQDSVSHQWEIIDDERKTNVRNFINAHPNSIVSAYAVTRHFLATGELTVVETLYHHLAKKVQQTTFGKEIKEKLDREKLTAIGKYAPAFTQNDTLGNPVSLSSFKGKYVLLDFWASWCGPCREENPAVVKAFQTYKNKNFTVLGVSLDRPGKKQAWLDAIHKDALTWTHVSDLKMPNEVATKYGILAIPSNFLIDPAGKIVAKNIRGEELEKKLAEIIKHD